MVNGCAWRALPSEFGPWFTIFQFFNRLSKRGFGAFLQQRMKLGHTAEAVFFDSTHCKVHQHANGPGGQKNQGIGRSRGGRNTKVHLAIDGLGRLAALPVFTPGNVSDFTAAPKLTGRLRNTAGVGDKGFDSAKIRHGLRARGCEACIPYRRNVKIKEPYDEDLYRARHCIENLFQRIKTFRRVAMRFEKTLRMFAEFVTFSILAVYEADELWLPM